MNADFSLASRSRGICQYSDVASKLEKYLGCCSIRSSKSSIYGIGKASFLVTSFRDQKSTQNLGAVISVRFPFWSMVISFLGAITTGKAHGLSDSTITPWFNMRSISSLTQFR